MKPSAVPIDSVNRFFQDIEARTWTDAEKELDAIKQKVENAPWYKGYVKALEGLLLTYRTNDDKYIYLPKALANRTEESVNKLRKEFGDFATNEIHGQYDRGYFKALEDYVTLLSTHGAPVTNANSQQESVADKTAATKGESLTPYLEESS